MDHWGVNSLRPSEAYVLNILRPRQNGRHFPDVIFNCIFLNENVWISIMISLMFVPNGPINNIPVLVQIKAWHWPADKPLSEPMMVNLPTHICVTRPQGVNCTRPSVAMIMAYITCSVTSHYLNQPWLIHWMLKRHFHLTHWGRDKMAAISQTTVSNAFSWMKIHQFRLIFHWRLFLRVESIIFQHRFR